MKASSYIAVAATLLYKGIFAADTNITEVPLYGLSPPVYPTRMYPQAIQKIIGL